MKATAIGPEGDVYLVGAFAGTPHFGQLVLNSTEKGQGLDAFVAKWSPASQQFVWAKRIGGTASDEAQAVAVYGGAVYVTGRFSSLHLRVGPLTLTNADTVASEHRLDKETTDVFVTKLTDAGRTAAFIWAQRAGGAKDDTGLGVAVNGAQVYLMGVCSSPVSQFGPCSLPAPRGEPPEDAGPAPQQFVAKLTDAGASGRFDWVVPTSGRQGAGTAGAVAVQGADIYVVGNPANDDDSDGWGDVARTTDSPYVTKLTDAGPSARLVWTQRIASGSAVSAVAVSGAKVYLAGWFWQDTLRLGSTVLPKTASGRNNLVNQNSFVAKLADAGARADYVWVQQAGGTGSCRTSGLAVTGARVYVTGSVWGSALFGTVALAAAPSAPLTLYVARLTDRGATGRYDWVSAVAPPRTYVPPREKPRNFRQMTTPNEVNTVATRGSRVYIAGGFNGQLQFGARVLAFAVPTNLAAFLASFTDSGR
ncbi:hypothetical protein [Hymenobacter antarcticus]|uniref:hypothetical protein n=1 Tax=Hymenobacter antarcticus TaxID=486270 RepID=UPI0031EABF75